MMISSNISNWSGFSSRSCRNFVCYLLSLYLTEILPADIDKVIYLDGDILVVDKLVKLWNTSVENYAIAAVPDSYNNKIEHYNRLRYPQTLGYFNAGMLVVNLKYWREKQVLLKFFDYVKSNTERLRCHDQDVLNYLFKNSKLVLPIRYNVLNEYWFDCVILLSPGNLMNRYWKLRLIRPLFILRVFLNHGIRTASIHGKGI